MEMKPYSYFGILIWSILTSQSYSMPEAREAKSFTIFNPFPRFQNSIDAYGAQIHRDPLIDSLIRHSSYPSNGGYEYLGREIAKLQHEVAKLKHQRLVCSSLMPHESRVIGSICYYVEPIPANYADALKKCRSYGGTLVEPLPSFSLSLWNALVKNFPFRMASISQFWIGATTNMGGFTFSWETTGTEVYPEPQFGSASASSFPQGALMESPGYPWTADNVYDHHPYVCWSSSLNASPHSYGYNNPYEHHEKTYP